MQGSTKYSSMINENLGQWTEVYRFFFCSIFSHVLILISPQTSNSDLYTIYSLYNITDSMLCVLRVMPQSVSWSRGIALPWVGTVCLVKQCKCMVGRILVWLVNLANICWPLYILYIYCICFEDDIFVAFGPPVPCLSCMKTISALA
jgi:hypothetical protein